MPYDTWEKQSVLLTTEGNVVYYGFIEHFIESLGKRFNIKPNKVRSTEKIDGAVATIMALDRAIRCWNDTSASVYDERGLLFL